MINQMQTNMKIKFIKQSADVAIYRLSVENLRLMLEIIVSIITKNAFNFSISESFLLKRCSDFAAVVTETAYFLNELVLFCASFGPMIIMEIYYVYNI